LRWQQELGDGSFSIDIGPQGHQDGKEYHDIVDVYHGAPECILPNLIPFLVDKPFLKVVLKVVLVSMVFARDSNKLIEDDCLLELLWIIKFKVFVFELHDVDDFHRNANCPYDEAYNGHDNVACEPLGLGAVHTDEQ